MRIYQLCQKVNGKDVVILESRHPNLLPKWVKKDYYIKIKNKNYEQGTKNNVGGIRNPKTTDQGARG